jgi:hypothetical protein
MLSLINSLVDFFSFGMVLVSGEPYYNLLSPVLVEIFSHLSADLITRKLIAVSEVTF